MAELEKEIRRIVQEEVNSLRAAVWVRVVEVDKQISKMRESPTSPPPTSYKVDDFTKRLVECHRKRPTVITDTFISEGVGPLPERHMKLWSDQEREDMAKELVKFLKKQARRHRRTPSAIAFSIVRALKLSGVEL